MGALRRLGAVKDPSKKHLAPFHDPPLPHPPTSIALKRGRGGIGRRAGPRNQWAHRVGSSPTTRTISSQGPVAQTGERRLCMAEVTGSIPVGSTIDLRRSCSFSPP